MKSLLWTIISTFYAGKVFDLVVVMAASHTGVPGLRSQLWLLLPAADSCRLREATVMTQVMGSRHCMGEQDWSSAEQLTVGFRGELDWSSAEQPTRASEAQQGEGRLALSFFLCLHVCVCWCVCERETWRGRERSVCLPASQIDF